MVLLAFLLARKWHSTFERLHMDAQQGPHCGSLLSNLWISLDLMTSYRTATAIWGDLGKGQPKAVELTFRGTLMTSHTTSRQVMTCQVVESDGKCRALSLHSQSLALGFASVDESEKMQQQSGCDLRWFLGTSYHAVFALVTSVRNRQPFLSLSWVTRLFYVVHGCSGHDAPAVGKFERWPSNWTGV